MYMRTQPSHRSILCRDLCTWVRMRDKSRSNSFSYGKTDLPGLHENWLERLRNDAANRDQHDSTGITGG